MVYRSYHQRGFTIVELLIVIVVIAILATISIVAFNGVQARALQSRLLSESNSIAKKVELFNAEKTAYPVSITDCPTPAATNLCLSSPTDETYNYKSNVVGGAGYMIHLNQSYEIQIYNTRSGIYYSNAEKTASNEFMQYTDLAPLIDTYGSKKYRLSFDIKSADISTKSSVNVYFQNGSTARYGGLSAPVNVTTSYQHYDIEFTPVLNNSAVSASMLAFYGTYSTGNIPTVKNLRVVLAE
jgi:prepilin-type N-terminal cleavage/methylation domain-containing protein